MGTKCGAHTFPYIDIKNKTAQIEHEATTSKIGEDQIFYCRQRGIDEETAVALIVNGFAKEVMNKLPMEFAVEAQKLLALTLEAASGNNQKRLMISIKNLHASIEDKKILKGIDLEVKIGEVHAIMGPNGSGKSTLASVLAGREEYKVTDGSIEFLGKNLLELSPDEKAKKASSLLFNIR